MLLAVAFASVAFFVYRSVTRSEGDRLIGFVIVASCVICLTAIVAARAFKNETAAKGRGAGCGYVLLRSYAVAVVLIGVPDAVFVATYLDLRNGGWGIGPWVDGEEVLNVEGAALGAIVAVGYALLLRRWLWPNMKKAPCTSFLCALMGIALNFLVTNFGVTYHPRGFDVFLAILAMIGSAALGALAGALVAWADRLIVSRRVRSADHPSRPEQDPGDTVFDFLRKISRRRNALENAARRTSGHAFVQAIGIADVFVIASMQSEGLDPTTHTPEELLAEAERVGRDLSEQKEFWPLVYDRDGTSCLPFFSSPRHCQTFIGEFSKSRNRVFGFQVLGVKGSVIASCARGVERVVLNDWSPEQRPLSDEEKRLLHETWDQPPESTELTTKNPTSEN